MFGPVVVLALQKRGVRLINARRGAFTLGACMMMGVAFVGFVDSPYAAIGLLSLAVLDLVAAVLLWTLVREPAATIQEPLIIKPA